MHAEDSNTDECPSQRTMTPGQFAGKKNAQVSQKVALCALQVALYALELNGAGA